MSQERINKLLEETIKEVKSLGIPCSEEISPNVKINSRATSRFGCCVRYGSVEYRIELSKVMLQAADKLIKGTLAHEILHTCLGCMNHQKLWQTYANQMNEAFGYDIKRTSSAAEKGVQLHIKYKHMVVCPNCGQQFPKSRSTNVTRHPEEYSCGNCGHSGLRLEY